jgi:hypothetical protein
MIYSTPGTFTVRALVTDDWYILGDPDSTGTAGDYADTEITVIEPTPVPSPTPSKGAIGGNIWGDLNSNGNKDFNEFGVKDIVVYLAKGPCGSKLVIKIPTDTTDSRGNYGFSNVSPGSYCLYITEETTVPKNSQYSIELEAGDNLIRNFGLKPIVK